MSVFVLIASAAIYVVFEAVKLIVDRALDFRF